MLMQSRQSQKFAKEVFPHEDLIATISSSSEEKILSFSSFGDKEITSINLLGNQEERLSLARNFLLPALEANRTILFDNPLTLSRIKSLLDEIKSSVPHEYVDAIAEDIRPILCGFINKGKMMDFWNTETLTFDKSIFPKGMTPEQVISYIKQCASEITDLINAKQDELILTQPKVYISGPISSNADYVSDFAKAEAELRERGPDICRCPVLVVSQRIDDDGDSAWGIALICQFVICCIGEFTAALLDSAIDIILRHVLRLRLEDSGPETCVAFRISASFCCDCDLLDQLRELLPALCVGNSLLVLYSCPFAMARHKYLFLLLSL